MFAVQILTSPSCYIQCPKFWSSTRSARYTALKYSGLSCTTARSPTPHEDSERAQQCPHLTTNVPSALRPLREKCSSVNPEDKLARDLGLRRAAPLVVTTPGEEVPLRRIAVCILEEISFEQARGGRPFLARNTIAEEHEVSGVSSVFNRPPLSCLSVLPFWSRCPSPESCRGKSNLSRAMLYVAARSVRCVLL